MFKPFKKNVILIMAVGISKVSLVIALSLITFRPANLHAATNSVGNVAGGSVTLTGSGNVTVNTSTLQLVKQVWTTGGSCMASMPADASCNSSATSVLVPSGTALKFLIYVQNTTDLALSDLRFQDLLDDAAGGFTYVANSIKRTQTGGSEPVDTDSAATIFSNADSGSALSDTISNADVAGIDTSASPDNLTVGATGNATLSIGAHKAFGIVFQVTKN